MNLGMALGSIAAFTALTYFTIAQSNEINHKKEIANNIKTLQATIKKQNYEGSKTNGILTSLKQTGDIKLSNLALGATTKDKDLLNKYQKAMEVVILTKDNPDCSDLNKTGIISYGNCVYIQNKKIKYATIVGGTIDVSSANDETQKELKASFKGLNQNNVDDKDINQSSLGTYRSVANHKFNENRVIAQNDKIVQEVANNDNIPQSVKVAIIKDKIAVANSVSTVTAPTNNDNINNNVVVSASPTNYSFVKVDNNKPVVSAKVEESKAVLGAYLDIVKAKPTTNIPTNDNMVSSASNSKKPTFTAVIAETKKDTTVINNNINSRIDYAKQKVEEEKAKIAKMQELEKIRQKRIEERKKQESIFERIKRRFGFGFGF